MTFEFLGARQTSHLSMHYALHVPFLVRTHFDLNFKVFGGPLGVAKLLAMFLMPMLKEIKWKH